MPFRIALSGLNAASTDLEVTGNNIANASTNGFKESRAEFADVYANALQDDTSTAAGSGVRVTRIAQQFGQGTIDFTSNNFDLAISGDGFFVLEDPDGSRSYTRAGAYSVDRNGLVVNHANQKLKVYAASIGSNGETTFRSGALSDLQLPLQPSAPSATTDIAAALNLDADATEPTVAFDAGDPSSYNYSTSTTAYDTLGGSHTATMFFRHAATPGQWDVYTQIDGNPVNVGGAASTTLEFDSAGALTTPASPGIVTLDSFTIPGSAAAPLNIEIDFSKTTQYGGNFAVNSLTQNGYTTGRLRGVDVDKEGVVFARFTNGQSQALGKVAMAKFNNNQGLRQLGDTNWAESFESGVAQLGEAGTSSFGLIQSGALESSNVDIAEQLVNLITAQRNYQANAQVITTADTVTQTIINIR